MLRKHFNYDTVNATLPRLVDVAMRFSPARSWWSSYISRPCLNNFRVGACCWVAMGSGVGNRSSCGRGERQHLLKLLRNRFRIYGFDSAVDGSMSCSRANKTSHPEDVSPQARPRPHETAAELLTQGRNSTTRIRKFIQLVKQ